MRAWRLTLAAACVGIVAFSFPAYTQPPGPGGPRPQAGAGDRSQFRVCNRAKEDMYVVMLWETKPDVYQLKGFFKVDVNRCTTIGGAKTTFPRRNSYYYAENTEGDVQYQGKDAFGCVDPSNAPDRTITGAYECSGGERIVGFTAIDENLFRNGVTLD